MTPRRTFPDLWAPPAYDLPERHLVRCLAGEGHLDDLPWLNRQGVDVRTAAHHRIRAAMLINGLPDKHYWPLMRPYLLGYWRKTDGMSTPFGIWYRAGNQVLYYPHDLDYYLQSDKLTSDNELRERAPYFDVPMWKVRTIYAAVRSPFGIRAYRAHARRARREPGYGTIAYIPQLPDFKRS